jgi:hypothetical protein
VKPFGTYLRVSQKRERGGESYHTLDDQRARIAEVAAQKGIVVAPDAEAIEENTSGSKKFRDRAIGQLEA